jgi:hypothetical protein
VNAGWPRWHSIENAVHGRFPSHRLGSTSGRATARSSFAGLRKDNQDLGPAGPSAVQGGPEEPVQPTQTGTGPFPLENYQLLPEGENFKCFVATAAGDGL